MKRTVSGLLGSAALAIGLMAPSQASAVVIDNFEQGAEFLMIMGPGSASGTQTGATDHIIGGHREIDLDILSTPSLASIDFVQVDVVGGNLNLSFSANVDGQLKIDWDNNGAGLGGVDLTDGGILTGVKIRFLFSDLGSDLTLSAMDTAGHESSLTMASLSGPSSLFFSFDQFVPTAVDPTDFTSISKVSLLLDAPLAGDYIIDLVEATANPEPATLAMGAMAIGGIGAATRRRREYC